MDQAGFLDEQHISELSSAPEYLTEGRVKPLLKWLSRYVKRNERKQKEDKAAFEKQLAHQRTSCSTQSRTCAPSSPPPPPSL